MNIYIDALEKLVPNAKFVWINYDWDGLEWYDTRPKPKKEDWEIEKEKIIKYQPKQNCKDLAKQLISACDWSVLPDVNLQNKSDFESYRSKLRELIINPVENPVFPIEPTPIWSN